LLWPATGCGFASKLRWNAAALSDGTPGGDLQFEVGVFRDALGAAHQPVRLQLHFHVAAEERWLEFRSDRERHRQQHGVFVAVIGEVAGGNLFGCRPLDVAGLHAGRQRPLQLRGQARLAGVQPIGVPVRLVRELQADPHRLAGRDAFGRMRHQLGSHVFGGDDVLGALGQNTHR
jgi:hypothetical protein